MNSLPPVSNNGYGQEKVEAGSRLTAKLIEKNGDIFTLKIKGAEYKAVFEGVRPEADSFKVEVRSTYPQFTVRLIASDDKAQLIQLNSRGNLQAGANLLVKVASAGLLEINGKIYEAKLPSFIKENTFFQAKAVSENAIKIINTDLLNRDDLKNNLISFISDKSSINATFAKVQQLDGESLKLLLANSGLFLENKLLKGAPVGTDKKYQAAVSKNEQTYSAIGNMQLANIMLGSIFTFFYLDDIEEDGIFMLKFDKISKKASVFIKMNLSRLGKTVINIFSQGDLYKAVVKSEADISGHLDKVSIGGLEIKWMPLPENDSSEIDPRAELISKIGKFQIWA